MRLGLTLVPNDGEDILGFLLRTAEHLHIRLPLLVDEVGLPSGWQGRQVRDDEVGSISRSLGLSSDRVRQMTLEHYPTAVIGSVTPHGGRVRHPGPGWVLLGPSRSCPECLAERPEVWYRDWNLGCVVACVKHAWLLDAGCRQCRAPEGHLRPFRSAHRKCHCNDADARAGQGVVGDYVVLATQTHILRMLNDSLVDPSAAETLRRARWWLAAFLLIADPEWPPPESAEVSLLRADHAREQALRAGAVRQPGGHDAEDSRPPRSVAVTAAWLPAAIHIAEQPRSVRQECLADLARRGAWSGQDSQVARRLRSRDADLNRPRNIWVGHRKPHDDMRDAAEHIAARLSAAGLTADAIPAFLPTRDDTALVDATPALLGRLWAATTRARLEDISVREALRRYGHSPGLKPFGHPIATLSALAPDVADTLLALPRDYRKLEAAAARITPVPTTVATHLIGKRFKTTSTTPTSALVTAALWTHMTHGYPGDAPSLPPKNRDAATVTAVIHAIGPAQLDDLTATYTPSTSSRTA